MVLAVMVLSSTCITILTVYHYITILQGGAPGRKLSWFISTISLGLMNGGYIYSYWDYKPTNITGGAPPCIIFKMVGANLSAISRCLHVSVQRKNRVCSRRLIGHGL